MMKIKSKRELARRVGRAESVIRKWLKDDRWPFAREGPWPVSAVPQMKAWAARTLAENPAAKSGQDRAGDVPPEDLGPERKARIQRTIVQTKAQLFALQRAQQQYHRVDECERRCRRKIADVESKLLSIAQRAPSGTAPHVREWLRGELQRIVHEYANGLIGPNQRDV